MANNFNTLLEYILADPEVTCIALFKKELCFPLIICLNKVW